MNQDKQNNNKKEIKCSAKMEIIYRITNEDGTIEERVANIDVPGKGDMDFRSRVFNMMYPDSVSFLSRFSFS